MCKAVCHACVEDHYLAKIIKDKGSRLACSACGRKSRKSITVEYLGELMEPIMRAHFAIGEEVKKFAGMNDDKGYCEQEGDSIFDVVQEVLGQHFDFEHDIVDAVIEAEGAWPPDGDEAYWETTTNYVRKPARAWHHLTTWNAILEELKHRRRFFSPAAKDFFDHLFEGIEDLSMWSGGAYQSVVYKLPPGTELFRARICDSRSTLQKVHDDPDKHLGPPPKDTARAGRMNAEGVVVFYGAMEEDTCLAEMRPAIGNEVVLMKATTTAPLRLLDFARLEKARSALSFFQPDYTEQVEKLAFLRRLHRLISQPVVPGKESDYLITQTLSEYLAHVHQKPFDGILFASVQREGGINIVLFARSDVLSNALADRFQLAFVQGSLKLFSTKSIEYEHEEQRIYANKDGQVWVSRLSMDDFDDELWRYHNVADDAPDESDSPF